MFEEKEVGAFLYREDGKSKKSDMVPEHLQSPESRVIRKEVTSSTMSYFSISIQSSTGII